jgi:hypothetical protein
MRIFREKSATIAEIPKEEIELLDLALCKQPR